MSIDKDGSLTEADLKMKRVSVDFPAWMLKVLDREAAKLGIPRQAVIKTRLAESLKERKY